MYTIEFVNILIETFAIIISLILLIFLITGADRKEKMNILFLRIVAANAAAILFEILSWQFNGGTFLFAEFANRAAVFLSYGLSALMGAFFIDYIIAITGMEEKSAKVISRAMYVYLLLILLLIFVSQFSGAYYYFDENNRYHTGEYFWVHQLCIIIFLLISAAIILKYRRSMGRSDVPFLLVYLSIPVTALIIQTLFLQDIILFYIASTVSIVTIYGGIQSRQAKLQKEVELDLQIKVMDAAPISLQIWDKDFRVVSCNDECVRFFGLKGKHEAHLLHSLSFVPENQPCGGNSLALAKEYNARAFAGERQTFEWIQLIGGVHIPVEITLDAIKAGGDTYLTAFVRDLREQKKNIELEKELTESRIAVMLSQIRPHFLYNALTAIQELCVDDPEMAREAVTEFSVYLRGNLDSLVLREPISFDKELKHAETYLSLEKKRFQRKLHISYDIPVRDFMLPALTLQPVVENAVRHGVNKRPGGGTVTISTRETDSAFLIEVSDDGIGFDVEAGTGGSNRSHVGISNVRSRLKAMCGGTLTLQSTPGAGTVATITIPKAQVFTV